MSRDMQEGNRWPTRRLGDVLVRHNEVIHPGERTGEATFVGLEHIEPNSGRRIGSLTIDLGGLTGRKPTFRRGQIVYGYLRPYLNKTSLSEEQKRASGGFSTKRRARSAAGAAPSEGSSVSPHSM